MKKLNFENYEILCKNVALKIVKVVNQNPTALICLGSGDTPLGVFDYLIKLSNEKLVDFSKIRFVGLDEWIRMDENDKGSCFNTMFERLFKPLNLVPNQLFLFNSKADDLVAECERIDKLIEENNGLDFLLLGIGTNGHLAMNEPNTPFDINCHISQLAPTTIETGQKYFTSATKLSLGITIGLQQISNAKSIILMANGIKKAEIIQKTYLSVPNVSLPSSILNNNKNCTLMVDTQAGSLIS
jgi:glucosamine-6-phosphate isomerase